MEDCSTDNDSHGIKSCLYGIVLLVVFVAIPAIIVKVIGPFDAFGGTVFTIAYIGLIYYLGNRK